jgi:hypothetical protein
MIALLIVILVMFAAALASYTEISEKHHKVDYQSFQKLPIE